MPQHRPVIPQLRYPRPAVLFAALIGVAACEHPSPTAATPPAASPPDSLFVSGNLAAAVLPSIGGPLPFLPPREQRLFDRGRVVFQTVFTPATGLGPTFNDVGCAACHQSPVVGGTGEDIETHATAFHNGVCDDLEGQGGPVIQDSVTPALAAALGLTKEPFPPAATGIGRRTTPFVLGFGLLDAVPDRELLALAQLERLRADGVHGRPHRLPDGRIGRFGRKAQVATLREFVNGAFVAEMGVTNPENRAEENVGGRPIPPGVEPTPQPELSQADVDATNAFMQLLAPPPPVALTPVGELGLVVFLRTGCAGCHFPVLVTGSNPVPAVSNRVVLAFSDLLLHDMGLALADICRTGARPADFRTEPLMGLRLKLAAGTALLHDGRAATLDAAITLHAGEGAHARDRFLALSPGERTALLTFLRSL
jgi:CxxC motif-containing protein (DUF1111 family)